MASEESKLQREILEQLDKFPFVVWAYITTSGLVKGWKGGAIRIKPIGKDDILLDILGQLKDGRLFSIEVKTPGNEPTKEQQAMIDKINGNLGVAGWADNVKDALWIVEQGWMM